MRRIVLLLAVSGIIGCDDGGGGGSVCPATPACGGDLTGTWTVQKGCLEVEPGFVGCSNASGGGTIGASGTVTFNADGTYQRSVAESVNVSVRLTPECLPSGVACSRLAGSVGDARIGTCSGNERVACTCHMTLSDALVVEKGTYSASANLLITMSGTNQGMVGEYCVNGDVLTVRMATSQGWTEVLTANRAQQ